MYKDGLTTLRKDKARSVLTELDNVLRKRIPTEAKRCIVVIDSLLKCTIAQKLSMSTVDVRAHYVINIAELFPDVELIYRMTLEREIARHESIKQLYHQVSSFFSGCLVTAGLGSERPAHWIVDVSCIA